MYKEITYDEWYKLLQDIKSAENMAIASLCLFSGIILLILIFIIHEAYLDKENN